eukprot:535133-Pelagomonas_calceolata.AAC.1
MHCRYQWMRCTCQWVPLCYCTGNDSSGTAHACKLQTQRKSCNCTLRVSSEISSSSSSSSDSEGDS